MRISHFLSSILRPVIALSEDVCDSTDDMLARVTKCNERDLSGCIVGSMDVESLYPSIDIDFAVDKCIELLQDSGIQFTNIDFDELGLFLIFNDTEVNLKKVDLLQYCPSRAHKNGRQPSFTASGINNNTTLRWRSWIKCTTRPTDITQMITYALSITLRYTLKNHVCTFNNQLYKQLNGGAIGVGIAGDVATLMMVWWDKQLKSQIPGIQLYARYVDDIDVVLETLQDDKTTMQEVQHVANAIHPSIRVTIDYPSNHVDGKLPVLDTKQWIENGRLMHTYYCKPMSSKHVVMETSALPEKMRTNILIADLLRVMRCVSPHCEPTERTKHVQHYMHRMQFSGYSQEQRVAVYKAAKKKYNNQLESNEEGVVPLYRSKQWNRMERSKAKRLKKRDWCEKSDAAFFVDATPGSQLSKQVQNVFRKCNLNVCVIERSGRTIKQMLTKSNPFQTTSCKCIVCLASGRNICHVRDCVYKISCSECSHKYIGETSRSLKERYMEHMMLYKRKAKSSVLFEHVQENTQPMASK